MIILLSGTIAQRKFNPRSVRSVHASSDYQMAAALMEHFVGHDEELEAYLNFLAIRAKSLIEFHWDDVIAVADALLKRRSLTGPEVRQILGT